MIIARYVEALAVGLTLLRSAVVADITPSAEDCDTDLSEKYLFGESSGSPWCASILLILVSFQVQIKQGLFVKGLKTWNREGPRMIYKLIGLEVKYSNNEITMIGTRDGGLFREFEWDPSQISVAGIDGRPIEPGANFQAFSLTLSDGKHLIAGHPPIGMVPTPRSNENGGTLLGLSGMYGVNGVEQIVFHMLKSGVKNSKLHDVELSPSAEELNQRANDQRGLVEQTLLSGHSANPSDYEVQFKLEGSTAVTKSKTWTNTISDTWHLGYGIEIAFRMNEVITQDTVTGKLDFFWEHKNETSNTEGESTTHTLTYGVLVKVPPHSAVRVIAKYIEGKVDVTWKGQLTITFENGKEFTIPADGTLKGAVYSDAWTRIENESLEDAIAAAKKGDGDMINVKGETISLEDAGLARRFVA